MANVEKISIALPADMAALVRRAVEAGDYASSSEVIREALREWKARRVAREFIVLAQCSEGRRCFTMVHCRAQRVASPSKAPRHGSAPSIRHRWTRVPSRFRRRAPA